MNWIIGVAFLVIVAFILDREVYFYEGVHLGPRVQAWLYDRWAKKYDAGKQESQLRDQEMLAQPLLNALQKISEPFILDFATGTGRLSHALVSHPDFKGHIIALDLSQGMLEQAAAKLGLRSPKEHRDYSERSVLRLQASQPTFNPPLRTKINEEEERSRSAFSVELLRHLSLPLPFPDSAFDVVCALEVLELFPNMEEPLAELSRVLRPGGILLTSRGTEESGRKAKVKSQAEFGVMLTKNDFANFQIDQWWKLFDRVIALKSGSSQPVGGRKLTDVLRCSACGHTQWLRTESTLSCRSCGKELSVTKEGIVLN